MQAAANQGVRVLVVDDNVDMRRSMELLLGRAGFEVKSAADGAQALELQRRHPANVLITDLLMPEKDGLETIEQFRRDFPSVKIIAMSGGGARVKGERHLATAKLVGADVVLQKPFEPGRLLQTLRELLTSGQ